MPTLTRTTVAVALVLALSCTWDAAPEQAPDGAGSAPASEQVAVREPAPGSTPPAPTTESAGAAGAGADGAASAQDSAATAPPPSVGMTAQELAARLDRLAAGQQALTLRIDSLTRQAERARADGGPTTDAQEVLGAAGQQFRSFGVGMVWAILVVILFNYLVKTLVWVLDALAERNPSSRLFYKKLVPITRILLWVFAAYLIVRVIFNVTAQGVMAAAAAVGVAIGFAAQDLLKNLFGGIILVFDQPFQVGDKISVGGTYGEVVSIGLRSTRLVTPDDNLVSVPNSQVVDGQVANANAGELNCQVVTDLYLPGWVDEARAKKIAFEAAASSKYLYLNKPIVVLVKDEFKETFLTRVRVKAYVLDPRYEFLFQSDVTERARAGFRDAGLLQPQHGLRAYLDLSQVHVGPGDEG
jgi:small-conductance mechanosensitive channel